MTTDETTSHSAKPPKDGGKAAGYSHLTNPASEKLLMEPLAIRLSEQTTLAKSLVMGGHPKDAGQVIGYSHSIPPGSLGKAMFGRGFMLMLLLLACSSPGQAADFVMQDLQGKTHRLADYRGKWVLVNFWATWCPPCLNEIPELISLHDAHKDKDLLVIGIAMQSGSRKKVADFAKAHRISYPVVLGDFKTARQIGVVDVLPASYLYNTNGEQVSYQAGEVTRAAVETYIRNK